MCRVRIIGPHLPAFLMFCYILDNTGTLRQKYVLHCFSHHWYIMSIEEHPDKTSLCSLHYQHKLFLHEITRMLQC